MLQIDGPTKLKLEKSAISLENSMALQNEVWKQKLNKMLQIGVTGGIGSGKIYGL